MISRVQMDRSKTAGKSLLLGLVGPCASGKSTLQSGLTSRGYEARHIAQEHSYVPDMWLRITDPDVLIFLDVSFCSTIERRRINWNEADYEEQQRRLQHARCHAHLLIQTDELNEQQVLEEALRFLGFRRRDG